MLKRSEEFPISVRDLTEFLDLRNVCAHNQNDLVERVKCGLDINYCIDQGHFARSVFRDDYMVETQDYMKDAAGNVLWPDNAGGDNG